MLKDNWQWFMLNISCPFRFSCAQKWAKVIKFMLNPCINENLKDISEKGWWINLQFKIVANICVGVRNMNERKVQLCWFITMVSFKTSLKRIQDGYWLSVHLTLENTGSRIFSFFYLPLTASETKKCSSLHWRLYAKENCARERERLVLSRLLAAWWWWKY